MIANISGTGHDIDKRKTALSTTIPSTFDEKKLVNFGPLTKRFTGLMFTHPRMNTVRAVYASAIAFVRWRCYDTIVVFSLKFLAEIETTYGDTYIGVYPRK